MLRFKKNNIIDYLIFIYIASSYICSLITKYVIIYRAITIFLIVALIIYSWRKNNNKVIVDSFIKSGILFWCFGFISMLWAKNPVYTFSRSFTIAETLLLIIFVYNYVIRENKKDFLIISMVLSGSIFSIYILGFYGLKNYIRLIQNSERIGQEITNVNTIGVILAFTCIIIFWCIMYQKKYWMFIVLPLNILVSIGTGSKKVIICMIGGLLMLVMFKVNNYKKIIKSIVEICIVVIILYFILQLPIFSTVNERFNRFFATFTGEGRADGSSLARLYYIRIGLQEFLKRPLWGVGLGNSKWITAQYVGKETYLHCNFVELLASVGIIGFVLYYAMYFIPIKFVLKDGLRGKPYNILAFVYIVLRLMMHFASVTYYDKIEYMNLLFVMCLIAHENVNEQKTNFEREHVMLIENNSLIVEKE